MDIPYNALDSAFLQRLLAKYKKNLEHLLLQAADYGSEQETLNLHNHIMNEQSAIAIIVEELESRGIHHDIGRLSDVLLPTTTPALTQGIAALTDLIRIPEVYIAVEGYSEHFRFVNKHISKLQDYKNLHDLLHRLQFQCYDIVAQGLHRIATDPSIWDDFITYDIVLRGIANELQDVVSQQNFTVSDTDWVSEIGEVSRIFSRCLDSNDEMYLQQCINGMKRVIDRQPSFINANLQENAESLISSELSQKMQRLLVQLQRLNLDSQKVYQFEQGVQALTELGERLRILVQDHNAWQLIDRQLRRIDENIGKDFSELEVSWSKLKARVDPMYENSQEDWAVALHRYADRLNQAILDGNATHMGTFFGHYRREIGQHFFRVDANLKYVCGKLADFRDPLANLQGMFG